ncbi:hypothetical protein [Streptomyces spinosirectus]
MNGKEFAERLGRQRSKVSRLENASRVPTARMSRRGPAPLSGQRRHIRNHRADIKATDLTRWARSSSRSRRNCPRLRPDRAMEALRSKPPKVLDDQSSRRTTWHSNEVVRRDLFSEGPRASCASCSTSPSYGCAVHARVPSAVPGGPARPWPP